MTGVQTCALPILNTAFKENKNLLAQYQEKYLYILVDEYQDTSGTQNELVQLLVNYWDQPNLFVVGDDDQSIFRFQGANVENMLQFQKHYHETITTIVLENNYRSTQPILNASTLLINNNEQRLINKIDGLTKNLVASQEENKKIKVLPSIESYNDPQQEMIGITEKISHLIAQGIAPKEIAVLYKENKYGEEMAHFLQQKNIPVFTKKTANLFDQVLIQQIIKILDYLACEWDQPNEGANLLFEILHFSWWKISPITIASLTLEANQLKYTNPENTFRKVLVDKTKEVQTTLFSEGGMNEVAKAMKVLEDLIGQVANVTLINLIEQVLQKTGIIQSILTGHQKNYELNIVSSFFDFIKEETHRKPDLTLEGLMLLIELMAFLQLPAMKSLPANIVIQSTYLNKVLKDTQVAGS